MYQTVYRYNIISVYRASQSYYLTYGLLYSGEAEILFGPMTGLEVIHAGKIHGTINHFVMRCAGYHSHKISIYSVCYLKYVRCIKCNTTRLAMLID